MNRQELIGHIFSKKSYLCVGLDTDIDRIPEHLKINDNPVIEFNRNIIAATQDLCVAYKINSAFYESRGAAGWSDLEETIKLIPDSCLKILDAKRGDIGNTADHYACMAFDHLKADAVTIAPYMGKDSVEPFLAYKDKWSILLALTSNRSSSDFEFIKDKAGKHVYEHVIGKSQTWASSDQLMFVIGATHPEQLGHIRKIAKDYFFLVPGIGAQGGDLSRVISACWIPNECGILINSSRNIIFASGKEDYAEAARSKAEEMVKEMSKVF